ncbi:hypothetical protein BIV60_10675 [Bacillus sp. MUM 116]|uniref:nucleotidyltransferase family protein n=1 Tax=Bacillus sp. MUM 116 TaxID=1678002 RepID=UPI0008F5A5AC|nr:nucleotidyltransferase family protein [Bacillus sp. MUM 116]OIK14988.1 hypothetical protein BIV60_10675 [Bacillus sp. MUM 116]
MPKIGAIILASGMSRRMGQPKLLLPLGGKPLFRYPIELAKRQQLYPIVFVAGEHFEVFKIHAADLAEVEFIKNENYRTGMSSSLKLGIEKIEGRVNAAFIFLADQPFVQDLVVQTSIQEYEKEMSKGGVRIVRPQYMSDLGHPILLDKSLFSEFLGLEGDQGGKEIIKKYQVNTRILNFTESIWGMDIDTAQDYQNANSMVNRNN